MLIIILAYLGASGLALRHGHDSRLAIMTGVFSKTARLFKPLARRPDELVAIKFHLKNRID
ncbi:MAG: hypothetical protein ISQ21_09920 [Alphaproteobacteria bacterium]|nr:hypothetical protein [Alphaproteobacteria bacterium]